MASSSMTLVYRILWLLHQLPSKMKSNPVFICTSQSELQLLHDDVVLEVRVPSEVEADLETHFVVLESFNLMEVKCLNVFRIIGQ